MVDAFLLAGQEDRHNEDRLLLNATKQQPSAMDIEQHMDDESPSDLPLGKALHLLLHVKPSVLTTAIDRVWKKTSPSTNKGYSPVSHALTSLDHYLTLHDTDPFLHHVYDPLKNKVLKPKSSKESILSNSLILLAGLVLWSPHRGRYQQCIEQELTLSDKRGALAAALILSSITKQWPEDGNTTVIMARFVPSLILVVEKVGELPTLLACTTYDTLLAISVSTLNLYLAPSMESSSSSSSSATDRPSPMISIIDEEKMEHVDGDRLKWVQNLWPQLGSVLKLTEKWQQSSDFITQSAWMELHVYMSQAHTVLLGSSMDGYQQVRQGWNWLCKVLVSSQLLSKNPTKKLKFVWKLENNQLDTNLASYFKLLMLALRQNGHWVEQQARSSSLRTADEQEYESHTKSYCRAMVESYPMATPWCALNRIMIPSLLGSAPSLCLPYPRVMSPSLYTALLDFSTWRSDIPDTYATHITPFFLYQPDTALPIVVSRIQPDGEVAQEKLQCSELCGDILETVTGKVTMPSPSNTSICELLAHALLQHVTTSNKSCELVLRCLPCIQKPSLLLTLMKMLATANTERANHVTKGLIAKTLLEETWCGDSLLVYIDLIRDLLHTRHYRSTFKSMTLSKHATPGDVFLMKDTEDVTTTCLDTQHLEQIETELLWPIQLWSTKVSLTTLERLIPLLIDKYYDAPSESIFIRVWQMLALSIVQQRQLMLAIITKCTDIMEKQEKFFDMIRQGLVRKEDINLYTLLLPILVLSIFPRNAYGHVGLPSTIIQQWQLRWPPNNNLTLKRTTGSLDDQALFIRLANALLIRYDYSGKVIGIPQIQKLALDTLEKIFYH